jgi:hypothetical protein
MTDATVPLWISPRELIGVPRGTRIVYPSGEKFAVVALPDGDLWLLIDGSEIRVPDESRAELERRFFQGKVAKKIH